MRTNKRHTSLKFGMLLEVSVIFGMIDLTMEETWGSRQFSSELGLINVSPSSARSLFKSILFLFQGTRGGTVELELVRFVVDVEVGFCHFAVVFGGCFGK